MSPQLNRDPTEFFSVVGAPPVREHHAETSKPTRKHSDSQPPGAGIAASWLVFYVVIVAVSLFANGGAAKLVEVAFGAVK